jgi:hypothetical protein
VSHLLCYVYRLANCRCAEIRLFSESISLSYVSMNCYRNVIRDAEVWMMIDLLKNTAERMKSFTYNKIGVPNGYP